MAGTSASCRGALAVARDVPASNDNGTTAVVLGSLRVESRFRNSRSSRLRFASILASARVCALRRVLFTHPPTLGCIGVVVVL